MKNKLFLLLAVMISSVGVMYAGQPLFSEAPFANEATATSVSISTSAWTQVPTTNTNGRIGLFVSNAKTNNGTMGCILSVGNTVPQEATTVRPIELEVGEGVYLSISDALRLYCISLHTSSESLQAQEVKQ